MSADTRISHLNIASRIHAAHFLEMKWYFPGCRASVNTTFISMWYLWFSCRCIHVHAVFMVWCVWHLRISRRWTYLHDNMSAWCDAWLDTNDKWRTMWAWFDTHLHDVSMVWCVWYLPTSCRCTHKHEERWFRRCDVLGYHTDGHNCRIKKSRHADVTPNITHFFSMSWDWYHAFFHMTRSNITQHIHGVTFHMLVCFTQLSHLLKKAPCGKRRDLLNACF